MLRILVCLSLFCSAVAGPSPVRKKDGVATEPDVAIEPPAGPPTTACPAATQQRDDGPESKDGKDDPEIEIEEIFSPFVQAAATTLIGALAKNPAATKYFPEVAVPDTVDLFVREAFGDWDSVSDAFHGLGKDLVCSTFPALYPKIVTSLLKWSLQGRKSRSVLGTTEKEQEVASRIKRELGNGFPFNKWVSKLKDMGLKGLLSGGSLLENDDMKEVIRSCADIFKFIWTVMCEKSE